MDYHSDPLWKKISDFSFDEADASYPFSSKLALEQNWSSDFTAKAIEEYRRFMYLCCILPGGASPSKIVDEVWHLHLTYTRNYWKKFCGETLQKEIHHNPSKGGEAQNARHASWYAETLKQYSAIFGQAPPPEIWPAPLPGQSPYKEIEIPSFFEKGNPVRFLLLLLPFLLIFLAYGQLNPYRLSGPHFLGFYFWLMAATTVVILISFRAKQRLLRPLLQQLLSNAGRFDALIISDEQSIRFQSLVTSLQEEGLIRPLPEDPNTYTIIKQASESGTSPLSPLLLQHEESTISTDSLKEYAINIFHEIKAMFHKLEAAYDKWYNDIAAPAVVIFLGALRCIQGLYNSKPIAILVLLMIAFFILCIAILYRNNFINTCKLYRRDVSSNARARSVALIYGFTALGITAISASSLFRSKDHTTGPSCNSGGCSGGGSCGGGGGCGGCGGD